MPYKDKEKQKEYNKERMRKARLGSTESVTLGSTEKVAQYPALLYALADPVKRAKLRRICEELKTHNQLGNVYYGAGETPVPFDAVSELLEVTR